MTSAVVQAREDEEDGGAPLKAARWGPRWVFGGSKGQLLDHLAMAKIPEYNDDFFEGEPGLLGDIIGFYQRLRWTQFFLIPPMWVSTVCCYPCFLNQNIEWDNRSRHVALTVDGIKFVRLGHQ
eukprot:Skav212315  [mRNA]  locus=scaffold3374:109708:113526:- [translate_table: standard]